MLDQIISYTNLPNLHPAMVHFPIVLLLVALLVDVLSFAFACSDWLRNSAVLLYVLGAASAGATFLTGRLAADSVDVPLQAQSVLTEHSDLALYTLWFFGVYAAIRLLLHWQAMLERKRWILIVMIVISLGGQGLLFATADHGGALVYQFGVAVRKSEIPEEVQKPKPPASTPTREGESLSWSFGPGAETQVADFLEVPFGELDPHQFGTQKVNGKSVLTITVHSEEPLTLVYKPAYQDVQVEAEIDLSSFNGSFGLVHHVNAEGYIFFQVTGNEAALGRYDGKKQRTLTRAKLPNVPEGFFDLKTVAAGRHFHGYLNGNLITHGHDKEAPAGKAGIFLQGTGTVRLANLKVTPLSQGTKKD